MRGVAVDAATVEIGFGDVDIDGLISTVDRISHIHDIFISTIGHGLAVYYGALAGVGLSAEIEAVPLADFDSFCRTAATSQRQDTGQQGGFEFHHVIPFYMLEKRDCTPKTLTGYLKICTSNQWQANTEAH